MNRGGVETWLLNVFRQRMPGVAFEVMVHDAAAGAYDGALEELDIRIHRNVHFRNPLRYASRFATILREAGPFDVVHSHVHHYSGVVLALAARNGVPIRVAHSHSDTTARNAAAPALRRVYLALMQRAISRYATDGFACSEVAGRALFGDQWERDRRWQRLYCGIDADSFDIPSPSEAVRAEFGLPRGADLLIHVGRFDEPKNHTFLIDVFDRVCRKSDRAFLLLVGTGPLEPSVRTQARRLGIDKRIVFCGVRDDVPRLLTAANVFVFPSIYEGLPLSCLEAAAAGIPLVVSDQVTPEVLVHADRSEMLPIASPDRWAEAIARKLPVGRDRHGGIRSIRGTKFDVQVSAATLVSSYGHIWHADRALSAGWRTLGEKHE
jgi:glycosyltransferase involved in cell wall biosynthesis